MLGGWVHIDGPTRFFLKPTPYGMNAACEHLLNKFALMGLRPNCL